MTVIALYTIKGGVGKTAAAVNLAAAAALEGYRTLLVDLDPQGAATYYLRVKAGVPGGAKKLLKGKLDFDDAIKATDYDNLDLLPSDFSFRNMDLIMDALKHRTARLGRALAPLADAYDVVVLDCPPGITLLSENILKAADAVLVPVIPTTLSLNTLVQLYAFARNQDMKVPLWPFLSMVDRRKTLQRDIAGKFMAEFPRALWSAIPYSSVVEQMGPLRRPVMAFAPGSPAGHAFTRLWREVAERLSLP